MQGAAEEQAIFQHQPSSVGHAAAAAAVRGPVEQPSRAEEKTLQELAAMDLVSVAAAGLRDSAAASTVYPIPRQIYSTVLNPDHEIQVTTHKASNAT